MKAITKRGQILALLEEGASTTGELVADLGWKRNLVAAHLCSLYLHGYICRAPYLGGRQRAYLWARRSNG